MNLPFASLHCTGFAAAVAGEGLLVAADAVAVSASAAVAANTVRIIDDLLVSLVPGLGNESSITIVRQLPVEAPLKRGNMAGEISSAELGTPRLTGSAH
jgi:hypothetical protein